MFRWYWSKESRERTKSVFITVEFWSEQCTMWRFVSNGVQVVAAFVIQLVHKNCMSLDRWSEEIASLCTFVETVHWLSTKEKDCLYCSPTTLQWISASVCFLNLHHIHLILIVQKSAHSVKWSLAECIFGALMLLFGHMWRASGKVKVNGPYSTRERRRGV